jgi:tRNA threonylcarbamoyladenosine biosynthesis protein TsaB
MLLAVDTATHMMSLALYDGRSVLAEQTWQTNNNHSVQLAPTVRMLMERAQVKLDVLQALAVCTGPGTYSGLRIGVSFAKGLASVRGLPLVGMSALDILAAGQSHYTDTLIVVVPAGRGRVAVGRYQWRKGMWITRGEAQNMDWETLFDSIDGPVHLTGEINDHGFEALAGAQAQEIPITVVPSAFRVRRAGFLAQEAWAAYTADPTAYAAALITPFYIKTQDVPQA